MSFIKKALFGSPSKSKTSAQSTSTPTLFGPGQLRTPTRTRALEQTTPFLTERALAGPDPRERRRLKTRAFEDIGASTKSALENLREIFGRTGVRGGVQGADVSDILEASIAAKGAASTDIESILKGDVQTQIQNLLQLLSQQEPFAVAQTVQSTQSGKSTGASKGLLDFVNLNVTKNI